MSTEDINSNTIDLDQKTTREILERMNDEDCIPPKVVRREIPAIARVVDFLVEQYPRGGRVLYLAAGTSARIAVMDAAECPPTFGTAPDWLQVRMAGGTNAVFCAQEGEEDGEGEGARAVEEWRAGEMDCVIGIAASGHTPFVLAGLRKARQMGAFTAMVSANQVTQDLADVMICCETGPEVITGSTRLKAASAAKLVLNMISTATMTRLGRVYGNRLCYIHTNNQKLLARAYRTLEECCNLSSQKAMELYRAADSDLAIALVAGLGCAPVERARAALERTSGHVRRAVEALKEETQ